MGMLRGGWFKGDAALFYVTDCFTFAWSCIVSVKSDKALSCLETDMAWAALSSTNVPDESSAPP